MPKRVLAIYRGRLTENRGTPIRVRSLLERIARDERFELTVASWDTEPPFSALRIHLTNSKFRDARSLIRAAQNADVVLGHTTGTWYYLLLLKLFARKTLVLEMHGFIEEESRLYGDSSVMSYYFYKLVLGVLYRSCIAITACSETAAEILRKYNKNVTTVYGGADTDMFSPTVAPAEYVRRAPGTILIGYAGNLRVWQGLTFLVETFRTLHERDQSFELAILTSEQKNLPQGEGIQIVPGVPHDEVPRFLAACDILVIPRPQNEVNRISFPSKLIEYMAMGKPVVASATSDCQRVITDGIDGLVYEPGNSEALIATLQQLKDERRRTALGSTARRKVVELYTWDRQADIISQVLMEAVS